MPGAVRWPPGRNVFEVCISAAFTTFAVGVQTEFPSWPERLLTTLAPETSSQFLAVVETCVEVLAGLAGWFRTHH